jgi:hypothetical protein
MRHIAIAAILACAAALPAAADPVAGLWRTEPGDEGGYLFVRVGPCGAEICGVTPLAGRRWRSGWPCARVCQATSLSLSMIRSG